MFYPWSVMEWRHEASGRVSTIRVVPILFDGAVELFPLTIVRLTTVFRGVR